MKAMMRLNRLFLLCSLACGLAWAPALTLLPAHAQTSGLFETLTDLNRNKPLQSASYDRSHEVLSRKILDRKNKVLGEVQDIVLTRNGAISALNVDFDRLSFTTPVYLNYSAQKISAASNGYMLGFEAADVEKLYPGLLANVEAAAGDGDDVYSLKRLVGSGIWVGSERRIGTVTDILFGANGDRAETLYVSLDAGTLRGKSVSIPYNTAALTLDGAHYKAVLTKDDADTILKYAQGQK